MKSVGAVYDRALANLQGANRDVGDRALYPESTKHAHLQRALARSQTAPTAQEES